MQKWFLILLLLFNCSGQTYNCFISTSKECEFDLKINSLNSNSEIDPYIITRSMAENQPQINSKMIKLLKLNFFI